MHRRQGPEIDAITRLDNLASAETVPPRDFTGRFSEVHHGTFLRSGAIRTAFVRLRLHTVPQVCHLYGCFHGFLRHSRTNFETSRNIGPDEHLIFCLYHIRKWDPSRKLQHCSNRYFFEYNHQDSNKTCPNIATSQSFEHKPIYTVWAARYTGAFMQLVALPLFWSSSFRIITS